MITELSLQALVAISEHPTISPCIQHLVIGLDCLKSERTVRLQTTEEARKYHNLTSAQVRLLDSGEACVQISRALNNFSCLQTVDIRDFNSNTRYRDRHNDWEPIPAWRSYGASEYSGLTTHRGFLVGPDNGICFVRRVFGIILRALGKSSARPRSLEVLTRQHGMGLQDDAFALFPAVDDGLQNILRGLTKLHLDLRISQLAVVNALPDRLQDPSTDNLRQFLASTPSVQWLRLNFGHGLVTTQNQSIEAFLVWLGLDPSDAQIVPGVKPVNLPLQKLELGCAIISPDDLLKLLGKFPLLETVSLRTCNLLSETSPDDYDEASHGSPWPSVFRQMYGKNPALNRLNVHALRVCHSNTRPEAVQFASPLSGPWPGHLTSSQQLTRIDKSMMDRLADNTWTDTAYRKAHDTDRKDNDIDEDSEFDEGSEDDQDEAANIGQHVVFNGTSNYTMSNIAFPDDDEEEEEVVELDDDGIPAAGGDDHPA